MIPASFAAAIVVINLIITILIGVCVGFVVSRALHRPWGARDAAIDTALAAVVAIAGALIVTAIDDARGNLQSRVMLVALIAIASVALRHLVRRPGSSDPMGG